MEPKDVFSLSDELNLYLTQNGIKPASQLLIHPRNPKLAEHCYYNVSLLSEVPISRYRFNPSGKEIFRKLLEKSSVPYFEEEVCMPTELWRADKVRRIEEVHPIIYSVGSTEENLERLMTSKTDEEYGHAFGFPEEAIEGYGRKIDGVIRDGSYLAVMKGMAKKAGIDIPSWLSYISYVPEQLDIVNGNISQSSKQIGMLYKDFVTKHNPDLARRIESDTTLCFPESWELTDQGFYIATYK